jgi:serpin B
LQKKTGKKRARTSDPTLLFTSGVWVDQCYSLNPSFEGIVREVYNAQPEVDFLKKVPFLFLSFFMLTIYGKNEPKMLGLTINICYVCPSSLMKQEKEVSLWVERKTRGSIKEVLPPGSVDNDVALILANTICFKGAWDQKFDASRTQLGDFHLLNGQIVQVPFLAGLGFEEHLY